MGQLENNIIEQVAQRTHSELILFFILLVVAMMAIVVPLYRMILSDRKERREVERSQREIDSKAENDRLDRYVQREAQIILVITQNTEVMAGLKATLETNGTASISSFARVHDRLDSLLDGLSESISNLSQIKTAQEHLSGNIAIVLNDIQKDIVELAQIKATQEYMAGNDAKILNNLQKVLMIVDNIPHNSNLHFDKSEDCTEN